MKPFIEMLRRLSRIAKAWRSEEENLEIIGHGYVLFYRGKPCGWARELTDADAHKWCPGVIAIGVTGLDEPIYKLTGGDEMRGATEWSLVWNPAPSAEIAEAATQHLPINLP